MKKVRQTLRASCLVGSLTVPAKQQWLIALTTTVRLDFALGFTNKRGWFKHWTGTPGPLDGDSKAPSRCNAGEFNKIKKYVLF